MDSIFIARESCKALSPSIHGTPLAPETDEMAAVLTVERMRAERKAAAAGFNFAVKNACTSGRAPMVVAIHVHGRRPALPMIVSTRIIDAARQ
jgi:hypothetical protein